MHIGRILAFAFAAFALVALIASIDLARGRTPDTQSALILDVLAGGEAKQCRRDVSEVTRRHIRAGMSAEEAKAVIAAARITPPSPWFWAPKLTEGLSETPASIVATRTLRTTAFGNELLTLDIGLADGKVARVAAQVECAFR